MKHTRRLQEPDLIGNVVADVCGLHNMSGFNPMDQQHRDYLHVTARHIFRAGDTYFCLKVGHLFKPFI